MALSPATSLDRPPHLDEPEHQRHGLGESGVREEVGVGPQRVLGAVLPRLEARAEGQVVHGLPAVFGVVLG